MQNSVTRAVPPSESYVVEIGGQYNSAYESFTAALKAGFELKNKYAQAQVKVYDASERPPAAIAASAE